MTRVHAEYISGEKYVSGWMTPDAAEDLADDLAAQGSYRNVLLEDEGED